MPTTTDKNSVIERYIDATVNQISEVRYDIGDKGLAMHGQLVNGNGADQGRIFYQGNGLAGQRREYEWPEE